MVEHVSTNIHNRSGRAPIYSTSVILAVLSSCTADVPFEANISARPSTVLELSWAKAKRTNQGIQVWGQVQQVHCCSYVRGYIHFEAEGAKGIKLASTNVQWGNFNPRQLHSAWFKAVLPVSTENKVSVIDIQFVTDRRK